MAQKCRFSQDEGRTCTSAALCTATTCQNGGECIEQIGYTECRCTHGFTGAAPAVFRPLLYTKHTYQV